MAAGGFLEHTSPTAVEVAQAIVQEFPITTPNDAQTHVVQQQQDVFRATLPRSVITTRAATQTQVKTAERQEGIVTKGLRRQTILITEALPLTQALGGQRLVAQQDQLQAAPLEVPLVHLEEDKSTLSSIVLQKLK
jgi:hypothetical protein|tara:strand:- start:5367 stop:5774 length:408 start_codon:yes stop_codon:yes gene_type:complete